MAQRLVDLLRQQRCVVAPERGRRSRLRVLPFEEATGDYYGGTRPGNNLYAESIVCLDARTGQRVWHFQTIHHGLWDYDLPAAPVLGDITVNGRRIKAVAQVSKQAFVYVFDRVTGQPVWPIEERPVPKAMCRVNGIHRRSRFPRNHRRSINRAFLIAT